MDKMQKEIVVVERGKIFGQNNENYFNGFSLQQSFDFEARILPNIKYMQRGLAEKDPSHKQPIGYCLIVNPTLKSVFAYQRSKKDEKYSEKRLQGKWSWGVGGHIERHDSIINPIRESMQRELDEEVEIKGKIFGIKPIGYINDDSDSVGSVHFGILYVAETDATIIDPKDGEMDHGRLRTIPELEEICSSPEFNVENWSRISMEAVKTLF